MKWVGAFDGLVVAQQRERDADDGEELAAGGVVDLRATSLASWSASRKAVTGTASLVSLSIISAMPMPQLGWQPQESWPQSRSGPCTRSAQSEKVDMKEMGNQSRVVSPRPVWFSDVVREVRQRVALCLAALVGDVFIAAGEADGLEGEEVDLLRVVERELDDAANLLVVDAVDDGGDGNDVDASLVQVVDGLELHVERVADLAVRVGGVADAVELQIGVAEAGLSSGLGELLGLGELDAVGCGLYGVVTNLAGVGDGVEEVRRERGLAAGELHAHLTTRLDGDRVVEHGLDLVPRELVDEADLVGVHEAGIAHHVAAVGEVDGEDGAAAVGDGGGAVVVQLLVVVGADVAAGEDVFEVLHHRRVDGHNVLEVAVDGAILDHQDLAVALDDLRLDLADLLVEQDLVGELAVDDLLTDLGDALGAEGVSGAGPAEGWLLFLIALEERLVAPLGGEAGVGAE